MNPEREQIQYLALDRIIANPQVREVFDETALQGLAASLKEVGQLQPIRVRKGADKFVIVDGERRLKAAKRAGMPTIAAIIEEKDLCEGEILHKQLISDCQKEQLSAMERADAIKRLMEVTGWSASEAAAHLGLSSASVAKYLAIHKLPDSIRDRVREGSIPASSAYELAQIDDPVRQSELAQQLAEGRLTRDGLAGARKADRSKGTPDGKAQPGRATAALGRGRSVTVAGDTPSLENWIATLEELLGKARRARTQGVELATFLKMLRDQSRCD